MAIAGLVWLLDSLLGLAAEWSAPPGANVELDLSPWALPRYTFFSLSRGVIAYAFSLLFTLLYGYWAAKDARAARVLIPLLDILQSVPVLAFLPGLLLALTALFPGSNTGRELAAVLMIFTGQVWNMTFSYYHSLRTIPADQLEAASIFRFTWWQRLKWVELPFATMGLVWNSMMSMAGGWFFLMINESYQLGSHDFRLPGVGAYMSVAVERGDVAAMVWAGMAMLCMIVVVDQLVWRPVVVWSQRFRVEEGGAFVPQTSWFLDWLQQARWLSGLAGALAKILAACQPTLQAEATEHHLRSESAVASEPRVGNRWLSNAATAALGLVVVWGAWKLFRLVVQVPAGEWREIFIAAAATLGRVLLATTLATLWTVPVGLAIGLSPRLVRVLQPVIQVAASFPAPMLFPLVVALLAYVQIPLGWGSVLLMLLGSQWYILFNVIAGAMAVPSDLREVTRAFELSWWRRFRVLYLPAVFPYLVTGWVTAAGGAWNASIVAEYFTAHGEVLTTTGLGGKISLATASANYPVLAASVLTMATVVVLFNRTLWRRLDRFAEQRFSLSK